MNLPVCRDDEALEESYSLADGQRTEATMREFIAILLVPLAIAALGLLALFATPTVEAGASSGTPPAVQIGALTRAVGR